MPTRDSGESRRLVHQVTRKIPETSPKEEVALVGASGTAGAHDVKPQMVSWHDKFLCRKIVI